MELPQLGKHCTKSSCNKLDFLPIKCDVCKDIFCEEHYHYTTHDCPNAYKKNNQVPVCPLCNAPIPVPKGQQPDFAVGAHIDNDCQADRAKSRRQVFTNKCSRKGCKMKEIIPVICNECSFNYCLKHRHPVDHNCEGKHGALRKKTVEAAMSRRQNVPTAQNHNNFSTSIQGNMSEDEALARALALSMQDTSSGKTQEELDLALARQLQASESPTAVAGGERSGRCNLS